MYSRLTTATMYGSLMNSLQESQRKIQDLQQQIASGNKYLNLAENPAAISRSLTIQSAINANNQYQSNTQNAVTMLKHADSALNNVLDAAQTIRDLVISAGTALPEDQLQDITAQIEANKKIMLDNLNTKVAGQYIFGGTDTSKPPFVETSDGNIIYQGTDDRIKYALSESLLGDISFTGNDIIPEDEDSYFICSHYVPLDWKWTGREEKVQITVGGRTLSVFIPETWSDNDINKTNVLGDEGEETLKLNYSDHNGYRDPNELSGLSLDDLATIVNRSLEEQGADMLVHAYIEKDPDANRQQLIIKSNTGEKVGITGWPDTDYMPMPATITTETAEGFQPDDIAKDSGEAGTIQGITGSVNLTGWNGASGKLSIAVGDADSKEIDLSEIDSADELVGIINSKFSNSDGTKFASLSPSNHLVLRSDKGKISVSGAEAVLGKASESTDSSLTITVGNESATTTAIYFSDGESMEDIAEKINDIEGVYARVTADKKNLVVVAERTGSMPEDYLNVNEGQEALHYPSLTIRATGNACKLFNFIDEETDEEKKDEISKKDASGNVIDATITARTTPRLKDQSHIDIFDYLGMETATKSREFAFDETLTVEDGEQLHWRITSGGRSADIKLNPGDYTIDDIAARLKNAGTGWLEVTVEPGGTDVEDAWGTGTNDGEDATKRLVMRGYNGEQVIFLDMNEYRYADKLGVSTALRTDAYDDKHTTDTSDDYIGTGMKCVNFPSAPCVDDNIGVPMRVQMNCGMYYDIDIKKADVIDKQTGFVDRALVMQEIVDQVNEQEGHDIMGFVQHVDSKGEEIPGSCAIYFLSGEAFTVVDMPFNDPEWNDYSGGLAAQMGIHGGVTSNLRQTTVKMLDNATFAEAYDTSLTANKDKYGEYIESNPYTNLEFREGTIRFSNLAHSVEIDVSGDDTVKDVMDRLRTQAGDWLYVNYYDTHMGQVDIENSGDFPIISISSIDGSAVNVLDIKGHIAEDALGLSTGIQGRSGDTGSSVMDLEWDIENENFPATALNITVAGYTHTLDLTALRDVTNDNAIKADDIAQFINARMQDEDVRAEINNDDEFVIYSPRGYSIEVEFVGGSSSTFLGDDVEGDPIGHTLYRGGYNLEGDAMTRGVDVGDLYSSGIHTQNATIRSGANTMKQNGFGVINDIIAAVNSGNRDDLYDKMIPKIDNLINNILGVQAEGGALIARYNYNTDRLIQENSIMTEENDNLVTVDPVDAITQLYVADYMYQANLAVIARLIQPSLLDFLS